jgi:hypothetical protein
VMRTSFSGGMFFASVMVYLLRWFPQGLKPH